MAKVSDRPQPILLPELCKGCGRCIEACPKHCITLGTDINQQSGLIPVIVDRDVCNGCGLCITACPEPFGLSEGGYELEDPTHLFGDREQEEFNPKAIPDKRIPLEPHEPVVLKGNHAAAVGAILAGCRHVFGYPITPSTEGAELMAKLLPQFNGIFLQAVSEVATVNHMYGCGGGGKPCMTFTSSPGFSLMLEGVSYMIGAQVPAVFVNVMRGGPGLGNIAPEQSDIKLMCHGLGHGNTQAIVLAPTTPNEMLQATMDAFRLSFEYRNPVIIAADGYLGQMTGRINLPAYMVEPGIPDWAVWGDHDHRRNLINSIELDEVDMEAHNQMLCEKYARITEREQLSVSYKTDDAETLIIACNTPARMSKGAVERLRRGGIKIGLFAPISLWPFPIKDLRPILKHAKKIVVVEASAGQLQDEVRLALSRAEIEGIKIHGIQRMGGIIPQVGEIVQGIHDLTEVHS